MKTITHEARLPLIGIRDVMRDYRDEDENGDGFPIGYQVCLKSESNLDIYFTDANAEVRAKVACFFVGGVLSVDVIDYAKVEPDAVPCGAEAVATASIRIDPVEDLR